jgi:Arc/MetJ family transcription regulator
MQITVTIDDELLAKAERAFGPKPPAELIEEGLRSLVYRQAARKLIALGGSDPTAWAPGWKEPDLG